MRLSTFKSWPAEIEFYCTDLAESGFFYKEHEDELECIHCQIRLSRPNWTAKNFTEHNLRHNHSGCQAIDNSQPACRQHHNTTHNCNSNVISQREREITDWPNIFERNTNGLTNHDGYLFSHNRFVANAKNFQQPARNTAHVVG